MKNTLEVVAHNINYLSIINYLNYFGGQLVIINTYYIVHLYSAVSTSDTESNLVNWINGENIKFLPIRFRVVYTLCLIMHNVHVVCSPGYTLCLIMHNGHVVCSPGYIKRF